MDPENIAKTTSVTKFEAAQRQLDVALWLWFHDMDPVPIHTLAATSHEILHTLFRKKKLKGLLFDMPFITDDLRKSLGKLVAKPYNFFKHARDDPEGVLTDFNPALTESIFHYSIRAIYEMGEPLTDIEDAYGLWFSANNPHLLTNMAAEFYRVNGIGKLRTTKKSQFLDDVLLGKRSGIL